MAHFSRASTAIEDNILAPSRRPVSAAELVAGPGRPLGGALRPEESGRWELTFKES